MNLTTEKIQRHIHKIRTDSEVFLIDTAQLKRRVGITYVNGESRPMYAAPDTIRCRLITRTGSERNNIAAQQREVQLMYTGLARMHVPYDVTVDEGDHILYTDMLTNTVTEYEVLYSPTRNTFTGALILQLQVIH